jgi:hypothetical protein
VDPAALAPALPAAVAAPAEPLEPPAAFEGLWSSEQAKHKRNAARLAGTVDLDMAGGM